MLLIRAAELDTYRGNAYLADVRCRDGQIVEIGKQLSPQPGETIINAKGNALIPGLHDHHLHLLALAAANMAVHCGPPVVHNEEALQHSLKQAATGNWIRGIQYHESVAGELNRWKLDQWIPDHPLRIQHRSGILWVLNSCAIAQLQLETEHIKGLERNSTGELTGRLFRLDHWLRKKMGLADPINLSKISMQLARYGITGLTDTGANNDANSMQLFEQALAQGELKQRVVMMGNEHLPDSTHPMMVRGALKVLLDDFQLPGFEDLCFLIHRVHQQQRAVAFHCVTETQLVFALAALEEAGFRPGDRIEHASLCPDEIFPLLKKSGAAVVSQPGFLQQRGEQYQQDIPASQHGHLYRCRSFLQQGIPFAISSDAPYGALNPWHNMQASIDRRNARGYIFSPSEALSPEQALQAYLKDPLDLYKTRQVVKGAAADLCLLSSDWSSARNNMANIQVSTSIINGCIINV